MGFWRASADYVATYWKGIATLLIPILLLPIPLLIPGDEAKCGAILLLMALYWMLDLLPLAVTALIPVALVPLLGLMSTNAISMEYFRSTNMLFLGGLIMAAGVEHSRLHRRIALNALVLFGSSPRRLMLGIMAPTAFLSMWISNTATTAMMCPIVEAVMQELQDSDDFVKDGDAEKEENGGPNPEALRQEMAEKRKEELRNLRAMLAMSVCYSANVGGTGTVIGSTPNLAFTEYLSVFPDNPISFGSYMAFAVPQAVVCLAIVYFWLQIYFFGLPCGKKTGPRDSEDARRKKEEAVGSLIRGRLDELGRMTFHEVSVLALFVVLVLLWFFRSPKFMTGWADRLPDENEIGDEVSIADGTPAILVVLFLFFLPAEPKFFTGIFDKEASKEDEVESADEKSVEKSRRFENSAPLLDWPNAQRLVPWDIIILIGGGFALAEVSERSCLSAWIGSWLSNLGSLPDWVVALIGSLMGSAMTQIASNAASAGILLPILRDLALELEVNPLLFMFPCMLMCSYAFMLPVSTGPNAIAFKASGLEVFDMIKLGIVLNAACLIVVMGSLYTYGVPLYDLDEFPDWAADANLGNGTDVCGYD